MCIRDRSKGRVDDKYPDVFPVHALPQFLDTAAGGKAVRDGTVQQVFILFKKIEAVGHDRTGKMCIRDSYYTLVTVGLSRHRMDFSEERREEKLERAELLINRPRDWKLTKADCREEQWSWPIRMMLATAYFAMEDPEVGLESRTTLMELSLIHIYSPQNGVILLVMAFLISPMGLPLAAIWLMGKVQSLKFAIQDWVYG